MSASFLFLILLAAKPADTPEAVFKSAIEDFEFGEHGAAAEKLRRILEPPQLTAKEDLIVARQYLGACYHLLDDKVKAKAQFSMLLALDPRHKLDPEVFSPALVEFFEDVRKETGLGLEKRDPEVKKAPPAVDPPAKKEPDPPAVVETTPSSAPPAALALIPFGVGQFANRHPVRGALFAVAEVGLFTTAAITFASFEGLKRPSEECGTMGSVACITMQDQDKANTLQAVYLATFWTGVGVAAIGIVEALISYPGDNTLAANARTVSLSPNGIAVRF